MLVVAAKGVSSVLGLRTRRRQGSAEPLSVRLGLALGRYDWAVRFVALLALAFLGAYVIYRIVETREGAQPIAFAVLLAAEFFSFITLALYIHDAWRIPDVETPPAQPFTIDIVIATYDESLQVLEPTIVASSRADGVRHVWVLDDGCRPEVAALCERLGARYVQRSSSEHAKAGNLNNALPMMDADLLFFLDADHVPARFALTRLSGYFADPNVAMVQSPHAFRNRDSAQHRTADREEQSLFFDVLLPGREAGGGVFWCGSAAMIRRSALEEIGGVAVDTLAEDMHTSVRLQMKGYVIRYHREVLVTGLAPHTAADYLLQRFRWAHGVIHILTSKESPIFARGSNVRRRLHFASNLLFYATPLQRLAYILILLMILILGWLPVGSVSIGLVTLIALSFIATSLAGVALARGRRDMSEGTASTWLVAGPFLRAGISALLRSSTRFAVTPKESRNLNLRERLRVLRLPLIVIGSLVIAWTARLIQEATGSLVFGWSLPGDLLWSTFWIVTVFVVLDLSSIVLVVLRVLRRRQYRALWRFSAGLPATADDSPVRVVDLHESGLSFIGPVDRWTESDQVRLTISGPAEHPVTAHGVATIHRVINAGSEASYAGSVVWDTDKDRWEIQDLCYAYLAQEQTR